MKRVILVLVVVACVAGSLAAETRKPSFFIPIVNDTAVSDTGRWEVRQDNMGRFVCPGPGALKGGFWPKRTGRAYLFGAGLWVGVLDPMRTQGDTAVSWAYNTQSGQSEFGPTTPDGNHNRYLDSLARMYNSRDPRDTAQWPERDSLGRAIISSDQELWAICNDLNSIYMVSPDSAIGIQVIRRTYAWNSPGPWGDILKVELDVKNVTGRWGNNPHTLSKVVLGACVDADIGYHAGEYYYFDYPRNLVVQYQTTQESGWPIPPPYYVGFKVFVETPKATDTVVVRDRLYGHTILPGQPLGLTALKVYSIENEPLTAGDRYLRLKGMFSSGDTNNAYGSDTTAWEDVRFLASCGPFSLPNDSTVRLSLHIIGGSDSSDIRRKAELLGVEAPRGPIRASPSGAVLYPVSPNPSSGPCLIRYALPEPSSVSLKVYNIAGRLVRELEKGEKPSGTHAVSWDSRDEKGEKVANGVYLFRLEAGQTSLVGKALLLR